MIVVALRNQDFHHDLIAGGVWWCFFGVDDIGGELNSLFGDGNLDFETAVTNTATCCLRVAIDGYESYNAILKRLTVERNATLHVPHGAAFRTAGDQHRK